MLPLLALLTGAAWAQEAPAEPAPEELPIIEGPSIVEYVEAPYPEEAKAEQIDGTVILLVELDDTGAVTSVEVSQPAGHGFDEAAVEAVRQMRFTPARTEAGPVPVLFEFAYGFAFRPEEPLPEEEAAPPPVNLDGWIRQMGTRNDVAGATVVVEGTEIEGTTDETGHFALRGVPPGTWSLKVIHPEHTVLTEPVEIVEGELTTANLWLRLLTYRDNEAVGMYTRDRQEVTRRTLTIEEVRRVPGTFGDPVKVIQSLPGAARTPFGTGLLVIRGSNPEDSAVYVDGIRVPIIYHLTGTTSVLSPDIVQSVDYLPGGYGVQYGRSLGGVVDVKTKTDFGEPKLNWGTDILDTQLYFEGQLGKKKRHGLAVGARRSYIDLFIPLFTKNAGFTLRPVYWDYQLKYVPELDADRRASVFIYGFDDVLKIATPEDTAQGFDQDTQGDLRTEYFSHRIVARYEHDISEKLRFELSPSFGIDFTNLGLGGDFKVNTRTYIFQIRSELGWTPHPAIEIVPGLDAIFGAWSFDFASPVRFSDLDDPLADREPIGFDGRGTGWTPDIFLKMNLRPLADRDRWIITPGIRANMQVITQGGSVSGDEKVAPFTLFSVDPRLSTRLEVFEGGWLKGSTGLYHQPPQSYESVGIGSSTGLTFEQTWQSTLGFEHQVTPAIQWDIDLFYRDMSNLIVFNEAFGGFGDSPFINQGVGRAYGMEIMARHNPVNNFFGWISYTLSRSERKDAPDQDWYPFDFDQTHILVANVGYDLPFDIGVSAQFQYVTGNPTTPYDAAIYDADGNFYNGFRVGSYNGERLPPYIQSSFRVDKLWTFRTWQLNTYVEAINAIRGVNPELTLYNYDYSEYAYVRGLPFIPNIGVEAKFWL